MEERAYLGIDLGGTNVLCGAVNAKGQILARGKRRTANVKGRKELVDLVGQSVQRALNKSGLSAKALAGVGIGAPGPVDCEQGVVLEMPNIPVGPVSWRSELQSAFGPVPVIVDNDVNAGTFGEFWRGAGRGTRDMVGVFVGTGTGGGIIIDGKILRGKTGITGEIGHIVLDPDGPKCGCGRRGCLEALASRTAMQRAVERAWEAGEKTLLAGLAEGDPAQLRSRLFGEALAQGDKVARRVVRDCAIHLGYGAVALVHLLSPERIVFGGGVMEALSDTMLPLIREVVEERCLRGTTAGVEIVPAALGDDAGMLGAAGLAMQAIEG